MPGTTSWSISAIAPNGSATAFTSYAPTMCWSSNASPSTRRGEGSRSSPTTQLIPIGQTARLARSTVSVAWSGRAGRSVDRLAPLVDEPDGNRHRDAGNSAEKCAADRVADRDADREPDQDRH